VTFNKPGTYSFTCTPHPSMIGQIIVTGPALASAPTTVVDTAAAKSTEAPEGHGAH
jgi:copper binding plastocyanin/azurin family protein